MKELQKTCTYDTHSEKELIKMWEDIKGGNVKGLNRNLMKDIDKNTELKIGEDNVPLYSKQMWDSEKGEWIPFSIWGAHYIVNTRKEYVVLRTFRPVDIQPEFGPAIRGWLSIDSSYLNEVLKEKKIPEGYNSPYKSFSGMQEFYEMVQEGKQEHKEDFYEMVRQDREEYKNEGRHSEIYGDRRVSI